MITKFPPIRTRFGIHPHFIDEEKLAEAVSARNAWIARNNQPKKKPSHWLPVDDSRYDVREVTQCQLDELIKQGWALSSDVSRSLGITTKQLLCFRTYESKKLGRKRLKKQFAGANGNTTSPAIWVKPLIKTP
jgi:hypothetical protein